MPTSSVTAFHTQMTGKCEELCRWRMAGNSSSILPLVRECRSCQPRVYRYSTRKNEFHFFIGWQEAALATEQGMVATYMTGVKEYAVAVVDDDMRVLESLGNLLESAGYAVHLFSSAEALLNDYAFAQIDCLISDIGMPLTDGFQLVRHVNKVRPNLPVVLMSGDHDKTWLRITARTSGQPFLRKPFSGEDLLAVVSKVLLASRPDE